MAEVASEALSPVTIACSMTAEGTADPHSQLARRAAAGDSQARGFLMGGTSGRTTLAGEGLQHQDGHSHLLASTIPNCRAYDPTYAYELAVIVHEGLRRMFQEQQNVFYYVTVMNENYPHPAMPEGVQDGIVRGTIYTSPSEAV